MWKLLKKLWTKTCDILPTAKRNHRGEIVSGPTEIKNVLSKEYKDRLRARPVRPDLISMKKRKHLIFRMKMKLAKSVKSPMWTMSDLEKALSDLKNGKSRDFDGFINEIFKKNIIGDDLKISFLDMFNKLRTHKMIPISLNFANITTVPKSVQELNQKMKEEHFGSPFQGLS